MLDLGKALGGASGVPERRERGLASPVQLNAVAAAASTAAFCVSLVALLVAGCASGPYGSGARAPDWEGQNKEAVPAVVLAPLVPANPAVPSPSPPPTPPAIAYPPTNQFPETWVSLGRWCKANGLSAPCLVGSTVAPGYALSATNGVFVLHAGSQVAQWNGLEIRMAFAPQIIGGQPHVHNLDLKKTLQPLVHGSPATGVSTNLTVVIDPGHGGTDSGAKSVLGYHYEKDFTMDWARRLASLLASNGWRVFLTRTSDTDLSLSNRIAFAEAHKAGVFVSLHFNSAAPNDQQAGLETYCLTPTGMPSTVTRGYGDDTGQAFPNNAFDTQNLQFALRVHRALLQVNGKRDRGVRRARFLGVLRGQRCPAILVEGGYLSNPQEARRIADPAYRQRLAEAVAQALTEKPELESRGSGAVSQRAEIRTYSPSIPSTNLLRP
jgi:N-acetylmuramoyl-L-alanine amidase